MVDYTFTSNRVVNDELGLNNCGIQTLFGTKNTVRTRDDYTLMYLSEGHAQMDVDGVITDVMPGEAMLFLPGAKQKYKYFSDTQNTNMWVHFSGSFCSVLSGEPARVIKIHDKNEFESNLQRLVRYRYLSGEKSDMLCDGYLRVIMAQLCFEEQRQGDDKQSTRAKHILHDVLNDIHTTPAADFDWDKYAAECFLSRDRFNHVFREHVGDAPERYRIKVCMERAKMLLCDFGMSVGECAETLGFRDVSYFCRRFKAHHGISPGEVRKNK